MNGLLLYLARGKTCKLIRFLIADVLGSGSTQATTDESNVGKDQPFWDSLNANVKNLHAVISGHGKRFPLTVVNQRS